MVTIRKANPGDLESIYRITVAAFGPYCIAKLLEDRYGIIDNKTWEEHKGGSVVSACKADIDKVFIAEEDGKVVGYATFGIYLEKGEGEVGNNAVDPDYQGRGIGTMLIGTVVGHLTDLGLKRILVTTLEHDYPAQRVYEKVGFREISRTVHYSKMLENGKVETVSAKIDDTKSRARYEKAGFKEITRSIHYHIEQVGRLQVV